MDNSTRWREAKERASHLQESRSCRTFMFRTRVWCALRAVCNWCIRELVECRVLTAAHEMSATHASVAYAKQGSVDRVARDASATARKVCAHLGGAE